MVTRRGFQALAVALRVTQASRETCEAVAEVLGLQSQTFDKTRLILCCGYPVLVGETRVPVPKHLEGDTAA